MTTIFRGTIPALMTPCDTSRRPDFDTLTEAEREARERYVAPVLRRPTPYLQGLFPGVDVALGDDLQITKLTRQAGPEDFDRLSDGTVEQVAVLLRLA